MIHIYTFIPLTPLVPSGSQKTASDFLSVKLQLVLSHLMCRLWTKQEYRPGAALVNSPASNVIIMLKINLLITPCFFYHLEVMKISSGWSWKNRLDFYPSVNDVCTCFLLSLLTQVSWWKGNSKRIDWMESRLY